MLVAATIGCWVAWGSTAEADWASCQSKPTRTCLLDEALRGDHGPLAGKDRLDVIILTDYRNHPEYLTAADIDEAKRQVTGQPAYPTLRLFYFALAANGLVAASQVQEALDLIPSLDVGMRDSALNEITAALIRAGKLDEVPIFGKPMLADPRTIFETAVKMLAGKGQIEQALAFMALNPSIRPDEKEMFLAVGVAYARRGDPKMAARFYDKAQSEVAAQMPAAVQDDTAMELRFEQIILRALHGDTDGAKAALKELPAVSDKPSNRVEINRRFGYQNLIGFLLGVDNPDAALDIAKSAPDRYRPSGLLGVALWDAEHGRLDQARAIQPLLGDKVDPRVHDALVRGLAIATAKSGDVTSAVALASPTTDPVRRRTMLFEVAQALRP
jgi:hypothetical protein